MDTSHKPIRVNEKDEEKYFCIRWESNVISIDKYPNMINTDSIQQDNILEFDVNKVWKAVHWMKLKLFCSESPVTSLLDNPWSYSHELTGDNSLYLTVLNYFSWFQLHESQIYPISYHLEKTPVNTILFKF